MFGGVFIFAIYIIKFSFLNIYVQFFYVDLVGIGFEHYFFEMSEFKSNNFDTMNL